MNSKEWRAKRNLVKEAYEAGENDLGSLSKQYGIKLNTLQNWVRKYGWKEKTEKIAEIQERIEKNMMLALDKGLESYIENPGDSSLQSLVVLIKDYMIKTKPAKELNTYIIRFIDQSSDYFLQKGDENALQIYQENIVELAEYLRVVNRG
jgi:hypothetical protein